MKALIGARCVVDNARVSQDEALSICVPAVLAIDSRVSGVGESAIADALANAVRMLADGHETLCYKTSASDDWAWATVGSEEFSLRGLCSMVSQTEGGELFVTIPGSYQVEIYKVDEI